ncbi:hypothetical protein BUY89_13870 [Staphylococcus equorum]|nr:hypothetical protein BUY89_13870 [Staphylococcus equorum]
MKFLSYIFGFLFQFSVVLLFLVVIKYVLDYILGVNWEWVYLENIPFLPIVVIILVIIFGVLFEYCRKKSR